MTNLSTSFACTYSPATPALLRELNCSIAITTYQAGSVLFLSPSSPNTMRLLPRHFKKAMGMTIRGSRMALATQDEITIFSNAPGLATNYPDKPGFYDAFFVPRATFYTGQVDVHDMDWSSDGSLWVVNTLFSCLATIDSEYSFRPQWRPGFLKKLNPEDACHLNGMAMRDGKPAFVTMFGKTVTYKGWRNGVETSGILMDVESNEEIATNLPMPHSPRFFDGTLYCLLSATGELVMVDLASGKLSVIHRHNGFVRGLAKHGDYLFVGLSKIRKSSSLLRDLSIAKRSVECGVDIIHLPSGTHVGNIRFLQDVEEIYDVQIIENSLTPGILNHTSDKHRGALHTPGDDFWGGAERQL